MSYIVLTAVLSTIPVEIISGMFFEAAYFRNSKLFESPDPILTNGTFMLTKKSNDT